LAPLNLPKERLSFDELKGQLDRLARDYLADENNVGLVIGVWKDGRREVLGYGSVSRDRNETPNGRTLFELASVGKTFTTAVLADMHRRGEVNLQDAVQKYLPADVSLPQFGDREITLEDLATHTAGLPSLPPDFYSQVVDEDNPYKDYTVEELHADLPRVKLERPPGAAYEYSNLGMGLLGYALSLRAGTSYEDLVIDRLCRPLHMESTRMTLDDRLKARLAQPHRDGRPVPVWEDDTLPGAGSFLSTGDDMLNYLAAHFDRGADAAHQSRTATNSKEETATAEMETAASEVDAALRNALRLCLQKRRPAD
jgi:CubicO group peptidase (beta-lactamase class C family)